MIRKKIGIVLIVLCVGVLCVGCNMWFPFQGKNSFEKLEEELIDYQGEYDSFRDYLLKTDYTGLYIHLNANDSNITEGIYYDKEGNFYDIEELPKEELEELYKYTYNIFERNKGAIISMGNNTLLFQLWANLEFGRGFAFSIDGEKPEIEDMTELEEMSVTDWYYFERR